MEIGFRTRDFDGYDNQPSIPGDGALHRFLKTLEGVKDAPFIARIPGALFGTVYVPVYNHPRNVEKIAVWRRNLTDRYEADQRRPEIVEAINNWLPKHRYQTPVTLEDVSLCPFKYVSRDPAGRLHVTRKEGDPSYSYVRFPDDGSRPYMASHYPDLANLEWP